MFTNDINVFVYRVRDMIEDIAPYLSTWMGVNDTALTDLTGMMDQGFAMADWMSNFIEKQGKFPLSKCLANMRYFILTITH